VLRTPKDVPAPLPEQRVKLLVTGGAGYVGSVVVRALLAGGHDVTVLDNLSTGHADAVPDSVPLEVCDLADAGKVLEPGGSGRFDGVLHFAAKSLVGESMTNPSLYWRNNVAGTRALLDAMAEHGVRRLVFSSTAAVYGEPDTVPIEETAPTRPTNAYGASKLAVDLMIRDQCVAHGLAAVSLRYFNVAGAAYGAGERHRTETHLIPIALDVALGRRAALDVYGTDWPTPDGTCVRDYVHVDDLARAHLSALEAAVEGTHLVCNLGSGGGASVREVVDAVSRATGHDVPVRETARRAGDPAVLVASHQRAKDVLGWQPALGLDRIVADAWQFHRQRHDQAERP
jgi:UDP-glucose 4-epimerase